jgi:hypothetical protein
LLESSALFCIIESFANGISMCVLIGASDVERAKLHQSLLHAKDFVEANIFISSKARVVELLEQNWINYLKEDLKNFLE